MIEKTDCVKVQGIEFSHGFNRLFEYYVHTDGHGWNWEIWRHRQGPICTKTWFASVAKPSRKGGVRLLNTAVVDAEGCVQSADPLYHINCHSHQTLLEALVPLIETGQWPT